MEFLKIIIAVFIGEWLYALVGRLLNKKKKAMTVKELKRLLAMMDENQEVRFADYEDDEDEMTQFLPIHGVEIIKYKNKKMVCIFYNPDGNGNELVPPIRSAQLN